MEGIRENPAKFSEWLFTHSHWWGIICGETYNVTDKTRREILLHLTNNGMYELAFVLLKTHGSNLSVERAITKAIADFTDEKLIKQFLIDTATHMVES